MRTVGPRPSHGIVPHDFLREARVSRISGRAGVGAIAGSGGIRPCRSHGGRVSNGKRSDIGERRIRGARSPRGGTSRRDGAIPLSRARPGHGAARRRERRRYGRRAASAERVSSEIRGRVRIGFGCASARSVHGRLTDRSGWVPTVSGVAIPSAESGSCRTVPISGNGLRSGRRMGVRVGNRAAANVLHARKRSSFHPSGHARNGDVGGGGLSETAGRGAGFGSDRESGSREDAFRYGRGRTVGQCRGRVAVGGTGGTSDVRSDFGAVDERFRGSRGFDKPYRRSRRGGIIADDRDGAGIGGHSGHLYVRYRAFLLRRIQIDRSDDDLSFRFRADGAPGPAFGRGRNAELRRVEFEFGKIRFARRIIRTGGVPCSAR